MKEIKKYTSIIPVYKNNSQNLLSEGDEITITEKLDGANSSFCIDEENPLGVSCYGRRFLLTGEYDIKGFYYWVKDNIVPIKDKLNPKYIYFGEWLIPHKAKYKENFYFNFYMFSIWDMEKKEYLNDSVVISEAKRLGLKTVPYFYTGKFQGMEQASQFLGKSNMTLEPNHGEGIVIKSTQHTVKYDGEEYNKQVFLKMVCEEFIEVIKPKVHREKKEPAYKKAVESVLTANRVDKILYKLQDEGIIEKQDINQNNFKNLIKIVIKPIIEDCYKEESELLNQFEEEQVKKAIGAQIPKALNEVLKKRLQENR
ncbi:MAG: RNA ligase family protein [Clostridium sp.]|nr:RNA ligase family protein [Clostridium sp.]